MGVIPTLETERLVLRAPSMDDYPAYAAFMASDRSRMMGGPHIGWAAWGMFASDMAMWALFDHGALMIDLKDTGECVGQVGINHGPMFPEKELGWMLYDGFEGRGVRHRSWRSTARLGLWSTQARDAGQLFRSRQSPVDGGLDATGRCAGLRRHSPGRGRCGVPVFFRPVMVVDLRLWNEKGRPLRRPLNDWKISGPLETSALEDLMVSLSNHEGGHTES